MGQSIGTLLSGGDSVNAGDGRATVEADYRGLENLGNTCYCNSVIQALYYCEPFRRHCLDYRDKAGDSMLGALAELFHQMNSSRGNRAAIKKFVRKVRKENVTFSTTEHHDAHEFFNFLINDIAETLTKKMPNEVQYDLPGEESPRTSKFFSRSDTTPTRSRTWVHNLFEGILTCETRCRRCDNVTEREEPFIDLSLEVLGNSTLEDCIESFGAMEELRHGEKYFCDKCGGLQEAERKLRIGALPLVLAVHLKRFKFDEVSGHLCRLTYNVSFPTRLMLPSRRSKTNTTVKVNYALLAVIVHIGQAVQHGHYVCCSYHNSRWRLFDDQRVDVVNPQELTNFYEGLKCGYLLFYKQGTHNPNETLVR